MKEIKYHVSVGAASADGYVYVDENASEEEISHAILNDLYDVAYEEVVNEIES